MNNETQELALFEATMRADPYCWVRQDFERTRDFPGQVYAYVGTQAAWSAWKAARDASVRSLQPIIDLMEKDAAQAVEVLKAAAQEIRGSNKASPVLTLINAQILCLMPSLKGAGHD